MPELVRDYEIRIWYSAEKGDECFVAVVESSQGEAVRDGQAKRGARREWSRWGSSDMDSADRVSAGKVRINWEVRVNGPA